MHRTLSAFATLALATAATAAPAPLDPVLVHAKLVQQGEQIIAELIAAESAREAYDREGGEQLQTEAEVKAKAAALNDDNAAYTAAASEHAAAIKLYNEQCGSKSAPAPRKFKTQQELDAAKAAEAQRVAGCSERVIALDAKGKQLDARRADLEARRSALQTKVDAGNASIDAQEKRGRELAERLSAAEEAADEWLVQMNQILDNKNFQARAYKKEGCNARREMVTTGKDLKVFHGYMYLCAGVLKGF